MGEQGKGSPKRQRMDYRGGPVPPPWKHMDRELLAIVVAHSDPATRIVCGHVNRAFHEALALYRRTREIVGGACCGRRPWRQDSQCTECFMRRLFAQRKAGLIKWAHGEAQLKLPKAACSDAARWGDRDLIEWIVERSPKRWNATLCCNAAKGGHLGLLQRLREQGCLWDARTFDNAARYGDAHMLDWLLEQGCPMRERTCEMAARGGHKRIVEWLVANGCPWDAYVYAGAARHGHLDLIRWFRVRYSEPLTTWLGCEAAMFGHMQVVRWVHAVDSTLCDMTTCAMAARGGHLDILEWLVEQGCHCDPTVSMAMAAYDGHTHVIAWLCDRYAPAQWIPAMCNNAASRGHIAALEWMRARGCPWNGGVCKLAVKRNQPHVVEWARARGCPWGRNMLAAAAKTGRLGTVRWLHLDMGCPMDPKACAKAAARGHIDVVKWLVERGCPFEIGCVARRVAARGRLDVMLWLCSPGNVLDPNGYDGKRRPWWWDHQLCTHAARSRDPELLAWLRERGCPWQWEECRSTASIWGRDSVVEWLDANRE